MSSYLLRILKLLAPFFVFLLKGNLLDLQLVVKNAGATAGDLTVGLGYM